MASDGTVDAGAPNLNLSPEEKRVYGQLFRQADTDSVGVVTGDIAVKFFEKTRLDSRVLGEIWQIADKENRGFLTPAGFGIVLRLIGHAQAGREPSAELALQQGPVPRFDGIIIPGPAIGPSAPAAPPALQAQGTGSGPVRIPPLTPEMAAQYGRVFERQSLQNGTMLPGDQAKQIFEKSGLPNEVLGRIWMLADTEQRGALVQTEFVIAMHLLTSMKAGTLRGLPTILPAGLYEAATRRGPGPGPGAARQQSPTTTGPPLSAIPRQLSGQAGILPMRTGSPLTRSPLAPQGTGDWLVTTADKHRFDQLFDELDKSHKGYITGEEAVPFFSQAKLSEDTLAQIWDLADIGSQGHLNREKFAVAMYLIRQQRTGGGQPLPAVLPPNLIPPSLRGQVRPPTATSPFDAPAPVVAPAPPPPQPKSALDDLFGLETSPPPTANPQVPIATGGSNADPFAGGFSPAAPSSPVRPSPPTGASSFKPFQPSSAFGRSIIPQQQATGDSTGSAGSLPKPAAPPQLASAQDDLLGDADPEINKKLNNDTTELANLSNQIGSLSKQMQDVQGQRTAAQNELNQVSAQKKNFEQRLALLRSAYEKEAQGVRALETQLTNARADTKKVQTDIALLEGTLQDLQNQRSTVLTALQADQQENANLKERIKAVNAEVAQLKPQIEKLKLEARQQKGLVAINKKQLATNEGERDKQKTEIEDLTKSNEELARQLSASPPPPAAVPAQVASPALSTSSANNPFFRRTASTDIAGTFSPPINKALNDKAFDDVFGPGPSSPQTTSTPPPLAFQNAQNTGTSTGSVGSFATPATSTPTVSRQATLPVEPSAVPESRQLSSSNLPFVDAAESLSPARQVSPPLSRAGPPTDTPIAESTPVPAEKIEPVPAVGSDVLAEPKAPSNGPADFFGAPAAGPSAPAAAAAPDPFAAMDQPKDDQAKAKLDFESAFASFKNSHAKAPEASPPDPAKGFGTFNTEFPPISELERDDESDSEDDQGGFEDDFAPASPPPKVPEKIELPKSPEPALAKAPSFEPEPVRPTSSGPAEPVSNDIPPSLASPATIVSNVTGPTVDDIFGSAASHASPAPALPTQLSQQSKMSSAFDDLDDDFDGLEDAKEGSADDDFANISRSALDDFNPVFDSSPPPSQAAKSVESAAHFGGADTGSSFDFASLSGSATGSTAAAPTHTGSTTTTNTATAAGTGGLGLEAAPASKGDAPDWDALFASLDDSASAVTAAPPAAAPAADAAKDTGAGRPVPLGRALTEEGVHDDDLLKRLVSMGYSRKVALEALEKYDYNLDRAANYLASTS